MTLFPWFMCIVIFVQPIYFLGRTVYAKLNGKEEDAVAYWADFKSWGIKLWDLIKWKVS